MTNIADTWVWTDLWVREFITNGHTDWLLVAIIMIGVFPAVVRVVFGKGVR